MLDFKCIQFVIFLKSSFHIIIYIDYIYRDLFIYCDDSLLNVLNNFRN